MCFYDAERPSFCETEIRVARKEHKCCECGVVIGRGEKYEHVTGVWDGDIASFKTCSHCRELREKVVQHERAMDCDGEEAIPPFGELRQAVYDMEMGR